MNTIATQFPGVLLLEPEVLRDTRGFFLETYNRRAFSEIGIDVEFVQDNHSSSTFGVLRGLHYQLKRPQAKLVRCIRGEIFDVAVDVRRGSPTFGQWTSASLSAENMRSLFIPEGFAHGFCVVSEMAEVVYKCSDFYAPAEERGVLWSDPDLAIDWPLSAKDIVLSNKDQRLLPLRQMNSEDLPADGGNGCVS